MKKFRQKLTDYLNGNLSQEEAKEFLSHFHSDEGSDEFYTEIERLWNEETDQEAYAEWQPSELFSQIQETKENQRFLIHTPVSSSVKSNPIKGWPLKIAASVLLFLTASWILWTSEVFSFGKEEPIASVEIVKSNPAGQKSTIFLSDGSKVVLNSGSQITYLSDFGQDQRVIRLTGEAYFEVKKDPRPFIVYTDKLATTALGTSFNINAYENQKSEVALLTGKVLVEDVSNHNKKLILNPGEAVLQYEESDGLRKSTFDPKTKTLWKDGVIYFNKTPLPEAINMLEQWYGVEVTVENNIPGDLYCTGSFKNDYLNNVLESIGFSLGFDYEIDNKKVRLTFKK